MHTPVTNQAGREMRVPIADVDLAVINTSSTRGHNWLNGVSTWWKVVSDPQNRIRSSEIMCQCLPIHEGGGRRGAGRPRAAPAPAPPRHVVSYIYIWIYIYMDTRYQICQVVPGTRSCQVPDRARYLIVPGTRSCQVPDRARYLLVNVFVLWHCSSALSE